MTGRQRMAPYTLTRDLRTAQLAAVASAIASDDKGVTVDDPRWTPTLEEARALVARVRSLGERVGELEREREDIAKAADERFEDIAKAPHGPLMLSAVAIVRRDRDEALRALARVRSLVRAYVEADEPASRTLREVASVLGSFQPMARPLDDREAEARLDHVEDIAEAAWGLLANASGGDWLAQSVEWREAAARWRDRWDAYLKTRAPRKPTEVKS